jgi:hypothetical protein
MLKAMVVSALFTIMLLVQPAFAVAITVIL